MEGREEEDLCRMLMILTYTMKGEEEMEDMNV